MGEKNLSPVLTNFKPGIRRWCRYQPGTQRWNNVDSTLSQLFDVESTLNRRCCNAVCPLGNGWKAFEQAQSISYKIVCAPSEISDTDQSSPSAWRCSIPGYQQSALRCANTQDDLSFDRRICNFEENTMSRLLWVQATSIWQASILLFFYKVLPFRIAALLSLKYGLLFNIASIFSLIYKPLPLGLWISSHWSRRMFLGIASILSFIYKAFLYRVYSVIHL